VSKNPKFGCKVLHNNNLPKNIFELILFEKYLFKNNILSNNNILIGLYNLYNIKYIKYNKYNINFRYKEVLDLIISNLDIKEVNKLFHKIISYNI